MAGQTTGLPTEEERRGLCELMALAFVELRRLAREGRAAQAEDLADAFHNLPREMYGRGRFDWRMLRRILEHYQAKHRGQTTFNYVAELDAIHPPPPA